MLTVTSFENNQLHKFDIDNSAELASVELGGFNHRVLKVGERRLAYVLSADNRLSILLGYSEVDSDDNLTTVAKELLPSERSYSPYPFLVSIHIEGGVLYKCYWDGDQAIHGEAYELKDNEVERVTNEPWLELARSYYGYVVEESTLDELGLANFDYHHDAAKLTSLAKKICSTNQREESTSNQQYGLEAKKHHRTQKWVYPMVIVFLIALFYGGLWLFTSVFRWIFS